MANYINESSNKYWSLFDDKQNQYNYLYNILPRLRFKKITYLKKTKKDKVKKVEEPILPEFISKREYKHNVDLQKMLDK